MVRLYDSEGNTKDTEATLECAWNGVDPLVIVKFKEVKTDLYLTAPVPDVHMLPVVSQSTNKNFCLPSFTLQLQLQTAVQKRREKQTMQAEADAKAEAAKRAKLNNYEAVQSGKRPRKLTQKGKAEIGLV